MCSLTRPPGLQFSLLTILCTPTGSAKRPDPDDTVYISNWAGVFKSVDGGSTFAQLGGHGLQPGVPVQRIAVSAADPLVMAAFWQSGPSWNTTRIFSGDGGDTWTPASFNSSLSFMPYNQRASVAALHPSLPLVAFNTGGDWVTRSGDGGATFAWASDGYNAVMVGGLFSFAADTPSVIMLSFQDYNGAVTTDGGATWTYLDVSGNAWGGFVYGGYAATSQLMWAGNAPSWGGPRQLVVSSDGGVSWMPGLQANGSGAVIFGGLDASYGLPGANASIGFASDWRTADGGRTWSRMRGCTSVLTHDADPTVAASSSAPPTLFGVDSGAATVTASADAGVTWSALFAVPGGANASDLAYDWQSHCVYAVASRALWKCSTAAASESTAAAAPVGPDGAWTCSAVALPPDQYNNTFVRSVAVDPVNPSIVYAGLVADVYAASNAVVRSTSSGAPGSWAVLLLDSPLPPSPQAPLQGPHEVSCVRVHPVTRALWAAGGCFGVWTAPPPPAATGRV
jgi:hypothetical protein